jgi:RNA-directed DNA polymerase
MKVLYIEGLANHIGPESCIVDRKGEGEALTGERAGWVLSCEINAPPQGGLLRGADVLEIGGRQNLVRRHGKTLRDPARSKTPRMYGCTLFGNREIPSASVIARSVERVGQSKDRSRR